MDYDMLLGASRNGARDQTLQLKVALVPDRNCWVSLPVGLCNQLYSSNCMPPLIFHLAPGAGAGLASRTSPGGSSVHNSVYVAWGGGTCTQKATVEVPSGLASCLGLRHGMACLMSLVQDVPPAEVIELEPAGSDDWEVLEQNSGHLEEEILNQVGVVASGQPLCVWARQQAMIMLRPLACKPAHVVRPTAGSEVHVAPKLRHGGTGSTTAASSLQNKSAAGAPSLATAGLQLPCSFRVLPMPHHCLLTWQEEKAGQPTCGTTATTTFNSMHPGTSTYNTHAGTSGAQSASYSDSPRAPGVGACPPSSEHANTYADGSSQGGVLGGHMYEDVVQSSWHDHHQSCSQRQQPHTHHTWYSWLTTAVLLSPSDMAHLHLQRAACLTARSAGPHTLTSVPPLNSSHTPASTITGQASAFGASSSHAQRHPPVQQQQLQQGQHTHTASTTLQPLRHSDICPGPSASGTPQPHITSTITTSSSTTSLPSITLTVRAIPWEQCPPGHAMFAPPILQALRLRPHMRVRLAGVPPSQFQPPPSLNAPSPSTQTASVPHPIPGTLPPYQHSPPGNAGQYMRAGPPATPTTQTTLQPEGEPPPPCPSNTIPPSPVPHPLPPSISLCHISPPTYQSANDASSPLDHKSEREGDATAFPLCQLQQGSVLQELLVEQLGGGSALQGVCAWQCVQARAMQQMLQGCAGLVCTHSSAWPPSLPASAPWSAAHQPDHHHCHQQHCPQQQHCHCGDGDSVLPLPPLPTQLQPSKPKGYTTKGLQGSQGAGQPETLAGQQSRTQTCTYSPPLSALLPGTLLHLSASIPSLHGETSHVQGTYSRATAPAPSTDACAYLTLTQTQLQPVPSSMPSPSLDASFQQRQQQQQQQQQRQRHLLPCVDLSAFPQSLLHNRTHTKTPAPAAATAAAAEAFATTTSSLHVLHHTTTPTSSPGNALEAAALPMPSCTLQHSSIILQPSLPYIGSSVPPGASTASNSTAAQAVNKQDGASSGAMQARCAVLNECGGTSSKEELSRAVRRVAWMADVLEGAVRQVATALAPPPECLHAAALAGGHLLLTGPPGSGKSLLAQAVMEVVGALPAVCAHVVYVQCAPFVGLGLPKVLAAFGAATAECAAYAPSVLVLDDLDLVCGSQASADAQGSAQGQQESLQAAEMLVEVMEELKTAHTASPMAILATAEDAARLHPCLRQAGAFGSATRLAAPGQAGRMSLMRSAAETDMAHVHFEQEQLSNMAARAEGYERHDLGVLMERAAHAACMRALQQQGTSSDDGEDSSLEGGRSDAAGNGGDRLTTTTGAGAAGYKRPGISAMPVGDADVEVAVRGHTPATFWQLQRSTEGPGGAAGGGDAPPLGLQAVGGLREAVACLRDALWLPAQYPGLSSQAPLRLRTGLLLCGPSGCGKTHLVHSAVAELEVAGKMRFLTVKGPELLNRYIGASEAGVRDLFARAAAAAPCALFFDEFDAIAPPRGHDSTGVTDRVVNQFLTELDGVEGLRGVCVMAATSRPDMVDPALLRPGRLDKQVYCGLPDQQDRLDILKALARSMPAAGGLDFEWLSHQTEGYTGADLKAILAEAQLLAVHSLLDQANHLDAPAPATSQVSHALDGSALPSASVPLDENPQEAHAEVANGSHRNDPRDDHQQRTEEPLMLSMAHVRQALANVRPSVHAHQKQHLEAGMTSKRATLA